MDQTTIRNFAIIAHIDHGKSTLADRLMELTRTVSKRDSLDQLLDSHPVSRERGITIRLAPVRMYYEMEGVNYQLNLIDTPGHVDFSYEVERSLAACEGAILLVDATQGIQAQTLSHFQKAKRLGLKIIFVINKIDSPIANAAKVRSEMAKIFAISESEIFGISARTGEGVTGLLEQIIAAVPPPNGKRQSPPRALVFSSQFDEKRGVIAFIRVIDGEIKDSDHTLFLATGAVSPIIQLGIFQPQMQPANVLASGEVGYLITNLKDANKVQVGDTITLSQFKKDVSALQGYQEPKPMVYVSLFPIDQDDYPILEDALKKLKLNDAAIYFTPTSSRMLGRGFKCGFLGHLHAEVSQERLENDFDLGIISTTPVVDLHETTEGYEEPWVLATIFCPKDFVGSVISLCEDRRGKLFELTYQEDNATLIYELPLSEIITDFFDQLKSQSSGFASIDYEPLEYRPFAAARLEILINHESIDALSLVLPKERAGRYGKFLAERLKAVIPRQQIPVPIQAVVDGQVVAREDIPAFRKDVIAKLYGGDVTRKRKLLEKQKKGKEKMKTIGKVEIPSDAFLKIFKTS